MKKQILLITFLSIATLSIAQETAKVSIARKKLYTGYGGPIKVFMDEKLICRINNNAFSVHDVPPGKHKFSVQWDGKKSKEKASEKSIEIEMEAGKEYYIKAEREDAYLKQSFLLLQEITAGTWKNVKEDLEQDDCL
jgi:hypothetical protein